MLGIFGNGPSTGGRVKHGCLGHDSRSGGFRSCSQPCRMGKS